MKYGFEFVWMFFGDKVNRGDLEIFKWGGMEGVYGMFFVYFFS